MALDLYQHVALSLPQRRLLDRHREAFLLGNTAPDVQVISGQRRETTHFYNIPVRGLDPAWGRMLQRYPTLARADALPEAQAAFLAGYLCHLQADQFWALEIFNPVFGLEQTWETFRHRLYVHNALRAYLDLKVVDELPAGLGAWLSRSPVEGILPFVEDDHLRQWRDDLAGQLQPDASVRTVEVFASRLGREADDLYQLLQSGPRMDQEVFDRLPDRLLSTYREHLLQENVALLTTYLKNAKGES